MRYCTVKGDSRGCWTNDVAVLGDGSPVDLFMSVGFQLIREKCIVTLPDRWRMAESKSLTLSSDVTGADFSFGGML